jgi:hypothetical protein
VTVTRLVGAGARPDVQHRPRVTERRVDQRGEPWILLPVSGVAVPDLLVARFDGIAS